MGSRPGDASTPYREAVGRRVRAINTPLPRLSPLERGKLALQRRREYRLTTNLRFCGSISSFHPSWQTLNWGFICDARSLISVFGLRTAISSRRISNMLYAPLANPHKQTRNQPHKHPIPIAQPESIQTTTKKRSPQPGPTSVRAAGYAATYCAGFAAWP